MADKVGGGDRQRTITAVEMRDNGYSGNREARRCIRRRRRLRMGDRRNAGQCRKLFWRRSIAMGVDASRCILPIGRRNGGIGLGIGASG